MFNIVFLSSPDLSQTGDFIYRVRQPGMALARHSDVRVISAPSICAERDELIADADLLILDMVGDNDLIAPVTARRGPTVYEMSDNIFDIQPWNPCHTYFSNPHTQASILQLIAASDLVQTTCQHLCETFSPFHNKLQAFQNQIRAVHPAAEKASDRVVVGWGGSLGHLEDVAAIADPIADWLESHPQVEFRVMGHRRIFDLFERVAEDQKSYTPSGPLSAYESFLDGLHIGIAPIQNTGFNRCRSDVKFLEYLAHGVVPVCANVGPYAENVRDGETGLLYSSVDDLIGHLDTLVSDADVRLAMQRRGHAYVSSERIEAMHSERRLEIYRGLCTPAEAAGEDDLEWAEHYAHVGLREGRYIEFGMTPAEVELYEGLTLQGSEAGFSASEVAYRRGIQSQPDHYLGHLYLGQSLLSQGNPGPAFEALSRALELRPASYQAQVLATRALAMAQGVSEAVSFALEVLKSHPSNGRLYCQLGELFDATDSEQGALSAYEACWAALPDYFPGAGEYGVRAFHAGKPAEAVPALASYLKVMPQHATASFLLGCALLQSGKVEAGVQVLQQMRLIHPDDHRPAELLAELGL